jgi:hypothetical protein
MYVVVSNNGSSTYNLNYIVCFKRFLLVDVCYIIYGGFQIKFIKLVADIVYTRLKRKSWFFAKTQSVLYHWGLGMFYTKMMNSSFHLYRCGKPPQPYR